MKIIFLFLAFGSLLSGCGNPLGGAAATKVEDNHRPGLPDAPASPDANAPVPPPAALGGPGATKTGPGVMRAAGIDLAAKAYVTNTDRKVAGTQLSARISLNKFNVR